MGFRFSLAAVLRIRQSLEDREERVLGQIGRELVQNAQQIDSVSASVKASVEQREQALLTPGPATELLWSYGQIEALKRHRVELEGSRAALEVKRAAQIKVYETSHRNRKMLTDLSDQGRALYDADLARHEQTAVDDSFNARRPRS